MSVSFPKAHHYWKRLKGLGWPILASLVAALLALVGLVQPVWSYEVSGGGALARHTFLWTWLVLETYEGGAWYGTQISPYAGPSFSEFRIRDAVGAVYLVALFLAIALVILVTLQVAARSRRVPANALTAASVFAIGLGFAAVMLAVLTVPPAVAADLAPSVSGFFGTKTAGATTFTWGPGLSWWLWLASTILALVVFIVPFAHGAMGRRPSIVG